MKVATSAYPLDQLSSWAQYEDKLHRWVSEAADAGAALAVFPEYAAMELATLDGPDIAADLEQSIHATSARLGEADTLHAKLAADHNIHILAGSAPAARNTGRPVNRARLFAPNGTNGAQDKQIMTRFEAEVWDIAPGDPLQLFDTEIGKIGILICYDSEFPLLGRALQDADLILVPSVTEAVTGYSRVRIGSQARALEQQCVTVMSSIVGGADWSEALGSTVGAGGIFGPPDVGFPETGIFAQGRLNEPGWTFADVDPDAIAHVRADGGVLNRRDWSCQDGRTDPVTIMSLTGKGP